MPQHETDKRQRAECWKLPHPFQSGRKGRRHDPKEIQCSLRSVSSTWVLHLFQLGRTGHWYFLLDLQIATGKPCELCPATREIGGLD